METSRIASALAEPLCGAGRSGFLLGHLYGVGAGRRARKITVDYTIELRAFCTEAVPTAVFSFLSGSGADQTGRSRMAFARYKEKPRRRYSEPDSPTFTSPDPRTSTQ